MNIISLMSGTSLDGLDIALCQITEGGHSFSLLAAETVPYPAEWRHRLASLTGATAFEYALADVELGHYFGCQVCLFRQRHPGEVDLVSSHGHTIFHQPHLGLTTQIGDGASIAAETGLPVAYDFRRLDVALGGQGAPLVPIGDDMLFSQYGACLNLGGFSNISYRTPQGERLAFDVSPCNMGLNLLAQKLGVPFDCNGRLASQGSVDDSLLAQLDALPYYALSAPKSLGKEWFDTYVLPFLQGPQSELDKLATFTYHVAGQIASTLQRVTGTRRSVLLTGGGAKNAYLVFLIRQLVPDWDVVVPSADVVDFKEAIVFALLGYLRYHNQPNTLASATGSRCNSVGGSLVLPPVL